MTCIRMSNSCCHCIILEIENKFLFVTCQLSIGEIESMSIDMLSSFFYSFLYRILAFRRCHLQRFVDIKIKPIDICFSTNRSASWFSCVGSSEIWMKNGDKVRKYSINRVMNTLHGDSCSQGRENISSNKSYYLILLRVSSFWRVDVNQSTRICAVDKSFQLN